MNQPKAGSFEDELDRLNHRRREIECALCAEHSHYRRMDALADLKEIERLLADIRLDMQRCSSMEGGE
jgi:hypothetical protein